MIGAIAATATKQSPRVGLLSRWLRAASGTRSEPAAAVDAPEPAAHVAVRRKVAITWPSLLARCREVVRADDVFAVGGDGLLVGAVGTLHHDEIERLAAHLSRAFDLADGVKSVGRVTECLCVRYAPEGRWLTAVRIAPREGTVVTIGVVGRYTLIERDRTRLRNTFLRLFEPLPSTPD